MLKAPKHKSYEQNIKEKLMKKIKMNSKYFWAISCVCLNTVKTLE